MSSITRRLGLILWLYYEYIWFQCHGRIITKVNNSLNAILSWVDIPDLASGCTTSIQSQFKNKLFCYIWDQMLLIQEARLLDGHKLYMELKWSVPLVLYHIQETNIKKYLLGFTINGIFPPLNWIFSGRVMVVMVLQMGSETILCYSLHWFIMCPLLKEGIMSLFVLLVSSLLQC